MEDSSSLKLIMHILNNNMRPCDLVAFMPYLTKFFLKEALLIGIFQLKFLVYLPHLLNHIFGLPTTSPYSIWSLFSFLTNYMCLSLPIQSPFYHYPLG